MIDTNGAFVRGLWGEADQSAVPTAGHGSALRAVRRSRHHPHIPEPLLIYVWGNGNQEFLNDKGYTDSLLVTPNAIENYSGGNGPRDPMPKEGKGRHQVNWGISFWRHKLESIRMGLLRYPAVVWLDWDTAQVKPLPPNFWARMAEGAPVQAGLRQYKRPQCLWRNKGRGQVPHGAFFYCRDISLVERAIELHAARWPTCTDEVAWACVIDELMGGWDDFREYHRQGYEPFCYDQRRVWRQFFPCPEPLFLNVGRF